MKNILIFCLLAIPVISFAADDKQPERIADGWTMTPKDGHVKEFQEALAAHMKFRESKNDPREWHVYRPVTGDKLNTYIIRSCCHEWADQDSYIEWGDKAGTQKHFNETVDPHVQSYSHNYTVMDSENSHWPKGTVANYVGVSNIIAKSGARQQMNRAIKAMTTVAKEHKWDHAWSFSYPVGGSVDVAMATPFENYADMAPLEENFYKFVVRVLDSEDKANKMFDDYSSTIESSTYHIYRHDKKLSMSNDK
ncbi:MAG: hypothetical protein AB8B80_10430 [Marinicellaceae bacterium]